MTDKVEEAARLVEEVEGGQLVKVEEEEKEGLGQVGKRLGETRMQRQIKKR